MFRSTSFWFPFAATGFLFSIYSANIVLLLNGLDQLGNPFLSMDLAVQYSWSVLPLVLAVIAFPLLVRRVALVLASRSFSSPKHGFISGSFLVLFLLTALVVYGPKFIPGLGQLAFGAGLFKLWLPIPILLSYIACEIASLFDSRSGNSGNVSITRIPEIGRLLLIAGILTFVIGITIYALSGRPKGSLAVELYFQTRAAILSAGGLFICASVAHISPRLTCSLLSVGVGAALFATALGPFSNLFTEFYSPLIKAIVYAQKTSLLPVTGFLAMLALLILELMLAAAAYAASALAFSRLTNHSSGTR